MQIRHVIATATLFFGAPVFGQTPAISSAKPWKGEVELGAVGTTGNTETRSVKIRASIIHERETWRQTGKFETLNTSNAVRTTAERYFVFGKSDYRFSEYRYIFALIQYEDDRFGGFDYRMSESIGYGRRVIHQPRLSLDLELGPGARQSKKANASDATNEYTLFGASNLIWKISDSATFSENFSIEWGQDSTVSRSVSALSTQVLDNLAMKLSFAARYSSALESTAKSLDTEVAVTLVYGF